MFRRGCHHPCDRNAFAARKSVSDVAGRAAQQVLEAQRPATAATPSSNRVLRRACILYLVMQIV
jgi:hypothetical protein